MTVKHNCIQEGAIAGIKDFYKQILENIKTINENIAKQSDTMTQFIIGASDKFYLKNDRQNMENKLITDIEKLRKEISDLKKEINRLKEQKFYFIGIGVGLSAFGGFLAWAIGIIIK